MQLRQSTIPSVNSEDHDGNYTVVVTNDFGSVTSEVINLQVQGSFLTAGLVAWYPFDGNASDMSGNGNDGVVNGASLGEDRNGDSNKAYSFDGNDYIYTNYNPILNSPKFTVSVWANPMISTGPANDPNGHYMSVFTSRDSPTRGFHIYKHSNSRWSGVIGTANGWNSSIPQKKFPFKNGYF